MNDLISRQAAIDGVKRLSLGETDAMRLAMRIGDYLERLSSAQPEPQWIPRRKRLPEEGEVVVLVLNHDFFGKTIEFGFWKKKGRRRQWEIICRGEIGRTSQVYSRSVLAWTPLPEQYKGK